jgi:cation diffusion facilitator family transporter
MHVLADTLTSVLAIVALLFGKYLGWYWLDAVMGIVGAGVILKWTLGLLKQTGPVLLDESISDHYRDEVITFLANEGEVTDLHIWRVSAENYCAAISLKRASEKTAQEIKSQLLARFSKIDHLTLEIDSTQS